MFGKKKELKLKGRINDILERIKETKNNLQGKNLRRESASSSKTVVK